MEKKIKVIIEGRVVRIMPHLLPDMERFGVTRPVPKKDIPKELLKPADIPRIRPAEPVKPIEPVKPVDEPVIIPARKGRPKK